MKDGVRRIILAGGIVVLMSALALGAGLGWFFWSKHAAANRRRGAVAKIMTYMDLSPDSLAYVEDGKPSWEMNTARKAFADAVVFSFNTEIMDGQYTAVKDYILPQNGDESDALTKKTENVDKLKKAKSDAYDGASSKKIAALQHVEEHIAVAKMLEELSKDGKHIFHMDEKSVDLLRNPSLGTAEEVVLNNPKLGDRLAAIVAAYESRRDAELDMSFAMWVEKHTGSTKTRLSVLRIMDGAFVPEGNGGELCHGDLRESVRQVLPVSVFMIAARGRTCVSLADGTLISNLRDVAYAALSKHLKITVEKPSKDDLVKILPVIANAKGDRGLTPTSSIDDVMAAYATEIYEAFGFAGNMS